MSRQPAATDLYGDDSLSVILGDVEINGSFSELSDATAIAVSEIRGKQLTVARIFAVAKTLEQAYANNGYPLVRVVIPPQKLANNGTLMMTVIDGFIEDIDVSGVPERARTVVAARLDALVGLRHVRITAIERALLIAGDVPGLKLRSTLVRGKLEGGTRLVLDGDHRLVTGSVGADDRLAASLGTWQLRGAIAVNSALGIGEQIYGTVGLGADLGAASAGASPLTVYGGGMVIPVGVDGLTVNPEYTRTTTRTAQLPGVPASLGTFDRFALRLRDPLIWTRASSLNANVSIEYITQQIMAPAFDAMLSKDAYLVVRAGPDYATTLPWGAGLQVGAGLSQGLTGRSEADAAASGIPLSRIGASSEFTKVAANLRLSQPLPADLRLDLIGLGQWSMGKPLLRSEQFVLDGSDAVSAFATGTINADQGATLRGEIARPFGSRLDSAGMIAPYIFGAVGHGHLFDITAVEQPVINASALGFGTRGSVPVVDGSARLNFGLELARQFTDIPGLRQGWRSNVNAAVEF